MLKLEYVENVGRVMRMDDIETIGVPTYDLLLDAIQNNRTAEALELAPYYHRELRIMHDILMTWAQDIMRYMIRRDAPTENVVAQTLSAAICQPWRDFEFGIAPWHTLEETVRGGEKERARAALERLWLEFKIPHDVLVTWINELLNYVSHKGETEVLKSILETYQSIWGDRYATWDKMTPWEKVALTVEGMRGHLSGASRKGDVTVREEADRYVIAFDPCGTGGVLRRGDPEAGRAAFKTDGMNKEPHLWTWGKVGVHWYCVHCAIAMEWLPGRRRGHPLRPLDHSLDPNEPTIWYVYKDEALTRDYHYPRTGLVKAQAMPIEQIMSNLE